MRNFSKLLPDDYFVNAGPRADGERGSGKSTGEALRVISEAMINPGIGIVIFDRSLPASTIHYQRNFVEIVQSWINKLDLKYLNINSAHRGSREWTLTYNIFIKFP